MMPGVVARAIVSILMLALCDTIALAGKLSLMEIGPEHRFRRCAKVRVLLVAAYPVL
jgi:hypothetical protein